MMFDLDANFGFGDTSVKSNTLEVAILGNKLFAYLLKNDEFK